MRLTAHKLHAALCSCPGGHAARVAASQHRGAVTPAALPRTKFGFHLNAPVPWSLQCSTRPTIFFCNHHLGRRCGRKLPRMLLQAGELRAPTLPVRQNVPDAPRRALSSAVRPLRLALVSQVKAFAGAAAAAARHDPLSSAAGSRWRRSRALSSRSRCQGPIDPFPLASAPARRLRVATRAARHVDRARGAMCMLELCLCNVARILMPMSNLQRNDFVSLLQVRDRGTSQRETGWRRRNAACALNWVCEAGGALQYVVSVLRHA